MSFDDGRRRLKGPFTVFLGDPTKGEIQVLGRVEGHIELRTEPRWRGWVLSEYRTAWERGVFTLSPSEVRARLAEAVAEDAFEFAAVLQEQIDRVG